jgi:hypothetical protein
VTSTLVVAAAKAMGLAQSFDVGVTITLAAAILESAVEKLRQLVYDDNADGCSGVGNLIGNGE